MSHGQLRAMENKITALKKKYWGDKTVQNVSRVARRLVPEEDNGDLDRNTAFPEFYVSRSLHVTAKGAENDSRADENGQKCRRG